ncbi:hypothetical protein D9615_010434 [Tricholomella constricta]|uniref:Major facilitator superfamily (MFS) profile domain-containing protein n=1 Tax=Tricholomella constricta TaxID=117010 RepID=A0A8H5LTL6_9AGAR|nr:hypothetical protein D9615_010434 [Tricholomella constricta]
MHLLGLRALLWSRISTTANPCSSFNISYSEVSRIPTLIQAGYAAGVLLSSPLGDLLRRRQLLLCLITLSTTLSVGLAVTNDLATFEGLSFVVRMVSCTPQILLPLAADLAPPERRASAISVVLAGLLFGILIARVLAGVIAEFVTWRVVYYLAIGTQAVVLVEPLHIQASLINIASSACFSNFWVTLTFLLGNSPYNYSTLVIGLFGLVGMFGVAMGPLIGKFIAKLVPCVQTAAGGIHIAAVIIAVIGLDVFRQMLQVDGRLRDIKALNAASKSATFGLDAEDDIDAQILGIAHGVRNGRL